MENLKVKVNNEVEGKEIQDLFFKIGCEWSTCGNAYNNMVNIGDYIFLTDYNMLNYGLGIGRKEITLKQLKDLVVLKRNSIGDANYTCDREKKYYVTGDDVYMYIVQGEWSLCKNLPLEKAIKVWGLKPINKESEVKMKEFLNPEQEYTLVKCFVGETQIPESWIEVPDGAEIFLLDKSFGEDVNYFVKHDGEVFHEYYISGTNISHNTWIKGTLKELHNGMGEVLWQRNQTTSNTVTQDKLKFIEKWLNGEKIQYILGIESDKSKWHNFTEGAMQYIKRPDIKFREAPKYVTINGIEFKNVKSLLKHVKNNFDLDDGE